MKWTDFRIRLQALISPNRMERELDDELSFHLEMQTRKNLAEGMNELDARRQARIQFGAGDSVAEECRDQRRVRFVETLSKDIRYALRGFRQTPLFALTVVATIALGLGWNTAAFTLFNAYVLRPIAVPDPYSLYGMRWKDTTGNIPPFTWLQAQELQTNHPAFSEAAIIERQLSRMNGRHGVGLLVSGNYFRMIGVHTRIGRVILPEDADKPGSAPVLVLSYAAWQSQFGGAPDVLGKTILVDGHPLEVIGVTEESFTGFEAQTVDYWAPITMAGVFDEADVFGPAQIPRFDIFGRLERGISEKQALAILTPWIQRRMSSRSTVFLYSEATLIPMNPRIMIGLLPIMVAFVLVLLSACANVANMTLARAMSRQREIGIRLSLGAPRRRLIRQLLTESVLLSLPAAAAGFWIAEGIVAMGVRIMFATIPREFAEYIRVVPLSPDWRVFGFMILAAILSAVLFGLVPALQATRMNVMQAARGDFSSGYRPTRLRNALVIAQVTICALLLICTGLLLRGAHHVAYLDTGMDTMPIVEIGIREKARQSVLEKLVAEPVVKLVAATSDPPLNGAFPTVGVSLAGFQRLPKAQYSFVSPQFFEVLAVPITAGRNFVPGETSVALISQTAAHQLFPNQDPLGQTIQLAGGRLPHPVSVGIVGVARDTNAGWTGDDPDRTLIYLTSSVNTAGTTLLVRVKGDTEAARQRLELILDSGEKGAVTEIHKMQEFVAGRIYPYEAAYWVSASVGGLALLLTLSGIYGVLSYVVAQRTKEIGIRMAIGANRWTLIRMILRQSLRLAAAGTLTGALLAFGTARLLAFALVGINAYDAVSYTSGVLVVLAACVCAAYFPARRAAGVNPTVTLRYD
jgi:predicted permease